MIQTLIRWGIFSNPQRRWTRMLGIKIHSTIPSCDIFGLLLSDSDRLCRLFCFYFVYCCVKHRMEHKSGTKTARIVTIAGTSSCWRMKYWNSFGWKLKWIKNFLNLKSLQDRVEKMFVSFHPQCRKLICKLSNFELVFRAFTSTILQLKTSINK